LKDGALRALLSRAGLLKPLDLARHAGMVYGSYILGRRWRGIEQLAVDMGWRANDTFEAWTRRLLGCAPRDLLVEDRFPQIRAEFIAMLRRGAERERGREREL
jgi:hypothetical protein